MKTVQAQIEEIEIMMQQPGFFSSAKAQEHL